MRRILIAVTIVALLVVPQFALAGDLDDFKAANDKLLQAYRSLDAEAIASMIYPGAVGFDYGAAFPSIAPMENTQTQLAAGLKMLFGYLEVLSPAGPRRLVSSWPGSTASSPGPCAGRGARQRRSSCYIGEQQSLRRSANSCVGDWGSWR